MNAKEIILTSRPHGALTQDLFEVKDITLPGLKRDEVLLTPTYMSAQPFMPKGEKGVITSGGVAVVETSNSDTLKQGDKVMGVLPWATNSILKAKELHKIEPSDIPDSYYTGLLGLPGMAAYFGFTDICDPRRGNTVVISGASKPVGIITGQLAKIMGCHVVGITDSFEKEQLLTKKYGFEKVLNTQTVKNLSDAISEACPKKVDCYFDTVGGEVTNAVIQHLNLDARIAVCGQMSLYNDDLIGNAWQLVAELAVYSGSIKGFLVTDYLKSYGIAEKELIHWMKDDGLHYQETIIKGFFKLPDAFMELANGVSLEGLTVSIE